MKNADSRRHNGKSFTVQSGDPSSNPGGNRRSDKLLKCNGVVVSYTGRGVGMRPN
jgi:hypothetical protein